MLRVNKNMQIVWTVCAYSMNISFVSVPNLSLAQQKANTQIRIVPLVT